MTCRMQLQREGKSYPKSSCEDCEDFLFRGCKYNRATISENDINAVTMKVLEKLRDENMLPPININGKPRQGISLDLYAQMLNMKPSDFDKVNTKEDL